MLFLPLSHRSAAGLALSAERTFSPPTRIEFERTPRDASDGKKRTRRTEARTHAESVVRIHDRVRIGPLRGERFRGERKSRRSPLSRLRRARCLLRTRCWLRIRCRLRIRCALRSRFNVHAAGWGSCRGEGGGSLSASWGRGRAAWGGGDADRRARGDKCGVRGSRFPACFRARMDRDGECRDLGHVTAVRGPLQGGQLPGALREHGVAPHAPVLFHERRCTASTARRSAREAG